jgi:hypothetical protein
MDGCSSGIIFTRLPLDQLHREIDHLGIGLELRGLFENVIRAVEVAVFVKCVGHQPYAHRAQGDCPLSLRDHDARQGRLAGLRNGFPKDRVNVLAGLSIWHQKIAGVKIHRIDRP